MDAAGLVSTIDDNIRTIDEYQRYPEKLAKYLTWKERYAKQLLCNVEAVENVMGGWIANNGKRFRAWVELSILIKAILKSWQVIPDLFYDYEAECSVCRNERHDAKFSIFKLISAVIPKIPIIKFPKWPDLVLDLHNVRLGVRIPMPEFHFSWTPIILPHLPRLGLPAVPTLGLGLPALLRLPHLPPLPDMPDMPSLPSINLPDLPPPPTIPKLFSVIEMTLNILKIVKKIMCIMRSNPFIPEWRAGDAIAQITERQGKLGIDFMNIEFPQFSASFVDAIKVSSFVNLEFQVDFLLEMAKSTFEPFNSFTSDFTNFSGTIPQGNLDFRGTLPNHIQTDLNGANSDEILSRFSRTLAFAFLGTIEAAAKKANESLSVEDFKTELRKELAGIADQSDPKIRSMLLSLNEGVQDHSNMADPIIAELLAKHEEKFRIAKEAIRNADAENAILKAKIGKAVRGELSLEAIFG